MWVTLVTHSLQVLAIALIVGGRLGKLSKSRAALGLLIGAIIDLVGYGLEEPLSMVRLPMLL